MAMHEPNTKSTASPQVIRDETSCDSQSDYIDVEVAVVQSSNPSVSTGGYSMSSPLNASPLKSNQTIETGDIHWILRNLGSSSTAELIEVGKEIKSLAKTADDEFWSSYSGTILSILLDHFSFDSEEALKMSPLDRKPPLTGYSPIQCPSDSSNQNESNAASLNGTSKINFFYERMIISSKILLAIAKKKVSFLSSTVELLVDRLCRAAAFAPVAVTLHSKQILSIVAASDGFRMLRALFPFLNSRDSDRTAEGHVNLLAVQVLVEVIKFLSSSQLLREIDTLLVGLFAFLDSTLIGLVLRLVKVARKIACRYAESGDFRVG